MGLLRRPVGVSSDQKLGHNLGVVVDVGDASVKLRYRLVGLSLE